MSDLKQISPKSWFVLDNFSSRTQTNLAKELLKIYSDQGDVVFDPLLGDGETLFACHSVCRNGVSFCADSNRASKMSEQIKALESQLKLSSYGSRQLSKQLVFESGLERVDYMWQQYSLPQIDLVLSFLPSWHTLMKVASSFYPGHSVSPLAVLENILLSLYPRIKEGAYVVLLVENHQLHGEYSTFAWEMVDQLKKHFTFKYEKICCVQKNSELSSRESDVAHKYLLVFRKE